MKPKFLYGISALIAALLIVGAIVVLMVPDNRIFSAQKSLQITADIPGMTNEELVAYAERMEQKYGPDKVDTLKSHVDAFVRSPPAEAGVEQNIRYVTAWNNNLEVRNAFGDVLASSDNALLLYKLGVTDEQGRDHYYWWQWSAAQNREDVYLWEDSNLRNFWNRVKLQSPTSDLLSYYPDSDIIVDSEDVCKISEDFVLHQDKIRPKPGECRVGSAGKYAVDWVGNYEGTQAIYGSCVERRPHGANSTVLWTYDLTASLY